MKMPAERSQPLFRVECAVAWIKPVLGRVIDIEQDCMKFTTRLCRIESFLGMSGQLKEIPL